MPPPSLATAARRLVIICPFPNIIPGYRRDVAPQIYKGAGTSIMVPKEPAMLLSQQRNYTSTPLKNGTVKPSFKVQAPLFCVDAAETMARSMSNIVDIPWEKLTFMEKLQYYFTPKEEKLNYGMPATEDAPVMPLVSDKVDMKDKIVLLQKIIDERKAVVLIGNNITMSPEEGGTSAYIKHHGVVLIGHRTDSNGRVMTMLIDPDNTVTHRNMGELNKFAKGLGKTAGQLNSAEIIKGMGDSSGLLREVPMEHLLNNISMESVDSPNGVSPIYAFGAVSGRSEAKPELVQGMEEESS